jgi:serine/tyrosine/threonine adenylyltransferase
MIQFENSFARDVQAGVLAQAPGSAPAPNLIILNTDLAQALGLDPLELRAHGADWFSGRQLPQGAVPRAMAYAGHQFGGFSPTLGDGRAHLLGEVLDPKGQRFDLHLKGSGRTAFSRGGDGRAALGPMLREYLISESMAALGLPTTRALAVVTTGESILRDQGLVPGAVLARVAASHIRVGTFQYFAARGDLTSLDALIRHTVARHYPMADQTALGLFDAVAAAQARLIADWMGVGFVHGVMNTDNMALSGETIDYGPCAFLDDYVPDQVFSSIDRQGRYAYANQPRIMMWNLARLAEALLPFFNPDEARAVEIANERLDQLAGIYHREWITVMGRKIGIQDEDLITGFLAAIEGADFTQCFAALSSDADALLALVTDQTALRAWLPAWQARRDPHVVLRNPIVIARNHLVEAALNAATAGEMSPFLALLAEVQDPYRPDRGIFALAAPAGQGRYVTFCGT